MFDNRFIIWTDTKWKNWYFYDVLSSKKYTLKKFYLKSKKEKIDFFWNNLFVDFSKYKNFNNIIDILNEKNFFNSICNSNKININKKKLKIKIIYDEKIQKEFIEEFEKNIYQKNKENSNFIFYMLPIFNKKKLIKKLKLEKELIPIYLSDSDLFIGPKLYYKKCPCVKCLNIRLGASAKSKIDFERQMYLDSKYPEFLKFNFFNKNFYNIIDILLLIIDIYINDKTKNLFVRYNFLENKVYKNIFLDINHKF